MIQQPSTKLKLFFWIILGAFSTFFAEITTGSTPFAFFTLEGLLVIFPLYFLHTTILATIIFRYSKPAFHAIFAAGALFGMYEAYMTKVLWQSYPASEGMINIAGIGIIEFIVLVFFGHMFLSFFLPLILGETLLTKSRGVLKGLPNKAKRWIQNKTGLLLTLIIILTAGSLGGNSTSPLHAATAAFSGATVLILLTYIWRTKTTGRSYNMRELLPGKVGLTILSILLALQYLVFGIFIRPEGLPGLQPQLIIWIAYIILTILFIRHLKKAKAEAEKLLVTPSVSFSWKTAWKLTFIFTLLATTIETVTREAGMYVIAAWHFIAIPIGLTFFFLAVKNAFKKEVST